MTMDRGTHMYVTVKARLYCERANISDVEEGLQRETYLIIRHVKLLLQTCYPRVPNISFILRA